MSRPVTAGNFLPTFGRVAIAAAALAVGGALLALSISSYRAYVAVAQAESEQAWGRLEAERETLSRAASFTPGDAQIHAALGSVHASIAQFRGSDDAEVRAISAFERAASLQPLHPERHAALAAAHTRFGHLDEAVEAYRRALDLDPHNALLLGSLATVREQQGRFGEAAELYREALSIRPNDALEARLERLEN